MEQSRLKGIIPFPSIRTQLLIISLVVLILPWISVQTIRDMEQLLQEQQVHGITTAATTILNGLSPVRSIITKHNEKLQATNKNSEIILSEVTDRILIDGYADDWPSDRIRQRYDSNNALHAGLNSTHIALELSSFYQDRSLILLLDITDDQLYQTDNPVRSPRAGDHLLLGLGGIGDTARQYIITSNSPGWLSIIPVDNPELPETRIQAEMQTRAGGYTIEISIPYNMASQFIALQVIDRDNDDPAYFAAIGNTPVIDEPSVGLMFSRSSELKQYLKAYRAPGQRLSLLDLRGNILASDGEALPTENNKEANQYNLYDHIRRLVLIADTVTGATESTAYKMQDDYVVNSLNNQSDHTFTRNEQGQGLLSVAIPIKINSQPSGSLIIQQSTEAITGVRHQALLKITLTSLSAMGVIILVLLIYATILIKRIRSLNYQMQIAANDDGRLQEKITISLLDDEIGELNRGMAQMIDRLQAYQQYLESMASKLSHELRTPLTVVQSSLENLQNESDELHNHPLIDRANEGLGRLKMILANLTEASRLENALKTTDAESFNLPAVIESCTKGYQQAFNKITFKYESNIDQYTLHGSADLIAQLLDKLVTNAIDFHTTGSAITIRIIETRSGCDLCVQNIGPQIPENIINTLFDSMVSARSHTSNTPHMGLGLYVVRLIATFHGGIATIRNEGDRVSTCVNFKSN